MTDRAVLIQEIEKVPEPLLDDVMVFVQFLKTKLIRQGVHPAVASETSLNKDWLFCAEEDEAWGDL